MRLLALLLALGGPVAAGPWPQDAGAVYVSSGVTHDRWGEWAALYAEAGLGRDLTLAFDVGGRPAAAEAQDRTGSLMLWASRPVGDWRLGVAAGAFADWGDARAPPRPRPRVALAAGRGFDGPLGPGWVSAEVSAVPGRRARAQATLGLRPSNRNAFDLTVVATEEGGGTSTAILPTWERAIGARAGLRLGLKLERDAPGVTLGIALRR